VMKGYYENPDATAAAFKGGWFHSGDLAVWHPDGYIELRDRKKDVIISGGENISTIEVEQVIVQHAAVLECAVVAIPDETWGERPKGVRRLEAREEGNRTGDHRLLPPAPGALQVPCCRRVWRLAQDLDREGAEVRVAREGVERTREAHPLAFLALLQDARGDQPEVPLQQLSSSEPTKTVSSRQDRNVFSKTANRKDSLYQELQPGKVERR